MFTSLFLSLLQGKTFCAERSEGIAFFKAAQGLYRLKTMSYMALNIPARENEAAFLHVAYSDRAVRHARTADAILTQGLDAIGLSGAGPVDWREQPRLSIELDLRLPRASAAIPLWGASFPLPSSHGETALFGIAFEGKPQEWEALKAAALRDIAILARYFHSHMLRLSGNDYAAEMLMSARELDCLKLTAAGKTAGEASEILGISERTVRFHLNSAREKMRCATTTQAVAKAVAQQLITI